MISVPVVTGFIGCQQQRAVYIIQTLTWTLDWGVRRNYLLKCEVTIKATHKAHTMQQPEEWQDWESITSSSLEEKEE